jgi:phosphohistidine phosphatase
MNLILWRHAQAQELGPGVLGDLQRPLTQAGHRQAQRMALWLHRHLPTPYRLLASPAVRTQETAAALHALSNVPVERAPRLAPGAEVADLLAAAQWPGATPLHDPDAMAQDTATCTVILVGHQPTLGLTAAKLLTGPALAGTPRQYLVVALAFAARRGAGIGGGRFGPATGLTPSAVELRRRV